MGWFWEKKKDLKPWWEGTTLQDVLNREAEVDKFLDEFTDYYQKHGWDRYGGAEALAILLLIERRKDRLSSHNGNAPLSKSDEIGVQIPATAPKSSSYDSANPPYGQS